MRFGDPAMLNLLWLAPLLIILFYVFNKSAAKRLEKFASAGILPKLIKARTPAARRWKFSAFLGAVALLAFALARPQVGVEPMQVSRVGVDVMIALDTSLSMAAEDVAPSRLAKAKREIEKLAEALAGNRLGLLLFAGEAVVESPLTLDVSTFKLFLNSISLNSIPVGGTDISSAIRKSMEAFAGGSAKSKVVVLITDGEDHEGNPVELAKKAAEAGVTIFTVGMGTPKGSPIPIRGEDGSLRGYKKDKSGEMVITRQNPRTLHDIALYTDGIFVSANEGGLDMSPIIDAIKKMDKSDITSTRFTSYVERFQIFLLLALLILAVEWAL